MDGIDDIDNFFSINPIKNKPKALKEEEKLSNQTAFDRFNDNSLKIIKKNNEKLIKHKKARQDDIGKSYARAYIANEEKSILKPDSHGHRGHAGGQSKSSRSHRRNEVKGRNHKSLENISSDEDNAAGDYLQSKVSSATAAPLNSGSRPVTVHLYDTKLGIYSSRKEVVDKINSNQVVVIEGPTGCGKTTQVPQFIYDDMKSRGLEANIIVTQPRRIAAISISNRVCEERKCKPGSLCGFQVGMKSNISDNTKITYCTTGVFLNKLIGLKSLGKYTHIVIDEVHERDVNIDFCLILVRKLLRTVSPNVKVILMSATIQSNLFSRYFMIPERTADTLIPAPVITLKSHAYVVTEMYIDNITSLNCSMPSIASIMNPTIDKDMYVFARELILHFDSLENDRNKGSVLVFLPGIREIVTLKQELESYAVSKRLYIIPLHSTISQVDQAKVFHKPQLGCRKVILSTNIAESSITVPDISYVLDFCLTKSIKSDLDTNYTSLTLEWASHANLTQRKGRAGRVSNGKVYRLIYEKFYHELQEFGIPEIERSPLENLILKVKIMDTGSPKSILALAISPPNLGAIKHSILHLKQVGALVPLADGRVTLDDDGVLTFVGYVLADLPLTIGLSKMLLYGYAFGALEDCIIIGLRHAASISNKSFMVNPFNAPLQSYISKLAWSNGSHSDCLAHLNVYKTWIMMRMASKFYNNLDEMNWGRKNYVDIKQIKEVREAVDEIRLRLVKFKIIGQKLIEEEEDAAIDPVYSDTGDKTLLLKVIMAGAFYPNYLSKRLKPEKELLKDMDCRNHYTTVMLKMSMIKNPEEYAVQIKDKFMSFSKFTPKVFFDETRVYVEFIRDADVTCKFLPSVYHALKMRSYHDRLKLTNPKKYVPLNKNTGKRLEKFVSEAKSLEITYSKLPSNCGRIEVEITHYVDCCSFYVQMLDANLQKFLNIVDRQDQTKFVPLGFVNFGEMCMAPYSEDNGAPTQLYRARVLDIDRSNSTVKVFFIDYGNSSTVRIADLKKLEKRYTSIPAMARLCHLANCEYSAICILDGLKENSLDHLKSLTNGQSIFMKVFSSLEDECRVDLYCGDKHINEMMVAELFLEYSEESLISQRDHRVRLADSVDCDNSLSAHLAQLKLENNKQGTNAIHNSSEIIIKGPTSAYEVEFAGLTKYTKSMNITVMQNSVNQIVLDERPTETQLLVASHMTVTQRGLMAHSTTLLPPHSSLLEIISMVFSPAIELRADPYKTRYTGVLCGLGWEDCSGPIFPAMPESDMELVFGHLIDQDDILIINEIRHFLNSILGGTSNQPHFDIDQFDDIESYLANLIRQLIKKKRLVVEQQPFKNSGAWKQISDVDLLEPKENYSEGHIFNLHCAIDLTH